MKLPDVTLPYYEVTLPSTGQKVKFRPFVSREEKLILMASESKDEKEIAETVYRIVSDCVDTDVSKLTFFDVDYILTAMRAKSVAETIEIDFKCNMITDTGETCGQIFPVNLDIANSTMVKNTEIENKIAISGTVGIALKYPGYKEVKQAYALSNPLEREEELLYASLDYIYDGESVYLKKDMSKEDFVEWLGKLIRPQYDKLVEWVENMPTVEVLANATCPRCKHNHKIHYKDMQSFFL